MTQQTTSLGFGWSRARDALLRFPLALLTALVSMAFFVAYFHDPNYLEAPMRYRAGLAFLLGVPLFTFLALLAEAWVGKSRFIGIYLAVAGFAVLELYRFALGHVPNGTLVPRGIQLGLAFFSFLALVPVFFRTPSDSVISFTRSVLGRGVKSAGLFVFGGIFLYLILLMGTSLLQIPFRLSYFERLLLQGLFVGVVWYFLAGIPASFGEKRSLWSGAHRVMVGPKGYGLCFLFGAVCFLFFVIRFSEKALDLSNYFLLLGGCWGMGSGIYFAVSEAKKVRVPALVFAFLLTVTSFGPWSAYSVVEASQLSFLEGRLMGLGIVKDGQLNKPNRQPTPEERQRIEDCVDYVNSLFGYTAVHQLIWPNLERQPASERSLSSRDSTEVLLRLLGLDSSEDRYISFQAREHQPREILGWHMLLPLHSQSTVTQKSVMWRGKTYLVTWDPAEEVLKFSHNENLIGKLDVSQVLARLRSTDERVTLPVSGSSLRMVGKWKQLEVQVDFTNIVAKRRVDQNLQAVSFESEILMKFPQS